ncbi:MAG: xylanase [Lachnospiraceae bacterium]|nr:xylanase [Lachnospiraceae bacterium]
MTGSSLNGIYINFFEKAGYSPEETDKRLEEIFRTLFYGSEDERIYHPVGDDMGYIVDTGNIDARTEGMSYGMMMCVQLNHKEEFDRIWKWARTYMYMESGRHAGFFCWSNALDGSRNSDGPAPDGEEYFAMALLFASHRWGDGEGIFNYSREACELLHSMIREGEGERGRGMFDRDNYLIRFIPEVDFTDPSYHLPHFYELFSKWAYPMDRTFYANAASASRSFWHKACHEISGLCSEYSYYDGTPYEQGAEKWGKHDWYYSDAYRTIMNIALDHIWFGRDSWQEEEGKKFLRCMTESVGAARWDKVLDWDGTIREEDALHPLAVIATNATASVLIEESGTKDAENALQALKRFWETPLRTGNRRYYDNCLYMFSFMILSGRYRIW